MTEECAKVAAEWWAAKIQSNFHHDNGDSSLGGVIANGFADSLAEPITEEQITVFKDCLVRRLVEDNCPGVISLFCDYSPGYHLAQAAREAGICRWNFPFKTGMVFKPSGEIVVRDGYSKPPEQIYPKLK